MPIEIRELHIKAEVNTSSESEQPATEASAAKQKSGDTQKIIAECVEQILEILNNKHER